MQIALIAQDDKKELLTQLGIAYCGILSKHNICATATTGKLVADTTGLNVVRFMNGKGGVQQIASRISYNEIDLLFFFRDPITHRSTEPDSSDIFSLCDAHNIPFATNIATGEVLIQGLARGDMDWRNIVNPK